MRVLISIVSHSHSELIVKLLESIDKYVSSKAHKLQIVITENVHCKIDYNCKFDLEVVHNLNSKGFGHNHNATFEHHGSDIFIVLNPDIVFFEQFNIDSFIEVMIAKKISLSSPIILNKNFEKEDYKRSNITLKTILRRKLFKSKDKQFDWYAGMFMIFSSEAFNRLGGFDPTYFMYVEDCDICMRARRGGFKIDDVDSQKVIHDAQRASRRNILHLKWHALSVLKYLLGSNK